MPRRIQQFRGRSLPDGSRSVARPSRWGNPWPLGATIEGRAGEQVTVDRDLAVELYRRWLAAKLAEDPDFLEPLRGWDLACYCALDEACHADVILETLR